MSENSEPGGAIALLVIVGILAAACYGVVTFWQEHIADHPKPEVAQADHQNDKPQPPVEQDFSFGHDDWQSMSNLKPGMLGGSCSAKGYMGLQCEIHNGWADWDITELTFEITHRKGELGPQYRQRVSLGALETATVNLKLGQPLPYGWDWKITDVKRLRHAGSASDDFWSKQPSARPRGNVPVSTF